MTSPTFTTYSEAQAWIETGQAQHGKRAFTARPEYHAAYAQLVALHKADQPNYQRPNRRTAKRVGGNANLLAYSLQNA